MQSTRRRRRLNWVRLTYVRTLTNQLDTCSVRSGASLGRCRNSKSCCSYCHNRTRPDDDKPTTKKRRVLTKKRRIGTSGHTLNKVKKRLLVTFLNQGKFPTTSLSFASSFFSLPMIFFPFQVFGIGWWKTWQDDLCKLTSIGTSIWSRVSNASFPSTVQIAQDNLATFYN